MKPMLASQLPETIPFPIIASPKLDGIRCLIKDGKPLTRTLKNVPNKFVQKVLSSTLLEGLDGELIVGLPTAEDCFRKTSSGVMSHEGEPDFAFHVFDSFLEPSRPFTERLEQAQNIIANHCNRFPIIAVPHVRINTQYELDSMEVGALALGYEGIMGRTTYGPYKFGRATQKEGSLFKVKRFYDSEAEVIGFEELQHNENEATLNELGYTKRSTHKANQKGANMLGALIVKDLKTDVQFNIGTGFDEITRIEIWNNRKEFIGKHVTYKYFHVGVKDKPRHPVFKGFREDL
jgi:DNA ligase-1